MSVVSRMPVMAFTRDVGSPQAAESGDAQVETPIGLVIRGRLGPTQFPKVTISSCTKIGKRKKQEDRCTIVPRVHSRDDIYFFGVFDGTVGDLAADYVHTALPHAVCGNKNIRDALDRIGSGSLAGSFLSTPGVPALLQAAFEEGYRATDASLIEECAAQQAHYASSTSVTALLTGDVLTLAHLGDSKIVLGRESSPGGPLMGRYLTTDHKPDMPEERRRIESCGGSLAYLHGGKPFIRGGDFTERQSRGDRPMQLNYSRAFGGKDLKRYGLLSVPDVSHVQLTRADRVLILASDGLWDVVTADTAVRRSADSIAAGRDPALDLTDFALAQHDMRNSLDNVTVVVVQFKLNA